VERRSPVYLGIVGQGKTRDFSRKKLKWGKPRTPPITKKKKLFKKGKGGNGGSENGEKRKIKSLNTFDQGRVPKIKKKTNVRKKNGPGGER